MIIELQQPSESNPSINPVSNLLTSTLTSAANQPYQRTAIDIYQQSSSVGRTIRPPGPMRSTIRPLSPRRNRMNETPIIIPWSNKTIFHKHQELPACKGGVKVLDDDLAPKPGEVIQGLLQDFIGKSRKSETLKPTLAELRNSNGNLFTLQEILDNNQPNSTFPTSTQTNTSKSQTPIRNFQAYHQICFSELK